MRTNLQKVAREKSKRAVACRERGMSDCVRGGVWGGDMLFLPKEKSVDGKKKKKKTRG